MQTFQSSNTLKMYSGGTLFLMEKHGKCIDMFEMNCDVSYCMNQIYSTTQQTLHGIFFIYSSVSYNDGNIKLKWSNASDEGPVHLDESTEHMPQFEVQSVKAQHFIDERRDLGICYKHSSFASEHELIKHVPS